MSFINFPNVYNMLKTTVDKHLDEPAFAWFTAPGIQTSITWKEHHDNVSRAAKSLMALGVNHNDKVNVLSYTCYPWMLADHATMAIGAVTVGIYQSLLPKDCKYIINHSDAVVIFVENDEQLAKIKDIRDELPAIKKVIMFYDTPPTGDDWIISLGEFMKLGDSISDAELNKRINAVKPEDIAGIVYTSGTTGVPKGAMLTHDNFLFTCQSIEQSLDVRDGDVCFLFLPMAHVFARICAMACTFIGVQVTMARGMDTIVEDIKASRPNWFPSVPRIYEKVYSKVLSGAEAKGGVALKIFRWAVGVGNEASALKQQNKPVSGLLGFKYNLAHKLVFHKIIEALGGNLRWCISGAAPLNADIAKFFHAAGILILEGIGMTENTSFSHVNRSDNYRFGWVGLPGPGVEQKIASDGEFMTRGRNTMKGYYKMPEETAATITDDGWLCTGDLGEIDDAGFLRITGRKKDLIITAGGKNVAPSHIEGVIATSKYINQVCVIGDRRKYLSALVTLDLDNVREYANSHGIQYGSDSDLLKNAKIAELIDSEVQEKNRDFASYESIKKVTIVPEFTVENGFLTPTLKVKKNVVINNYESDIEKMY
ncbi:MAG: long-chain fatty acid--CoA ligase [Calditrichaeota bacterium]|nr:long-chain fatty acid--CoA ligase [Calditrichota bacterium]MCB0268621.1 long-chain fatty acid--CoA ligase [Calditrichota bacterium]